ncbi:MAG: helix-turn-helix domain-containing protein [Methanolinea tarda]|nr:helix-turn-helix domain-containing protein [Methanolinea sp.]
MPAEVADLLKVHVKTMREMIKSTRLRATEIGREYRITGEQMRRYPEENKIK